jgi:hypothetical protein
MRSDHVACIISIYVPCRTSHVGGERTVMNQQRCYFAKAGLFMDCPQTILLEDLRTLLQEWRQNGERIVVFTNANENMSDGPFNSLFSHPDLGMKEAVTSCHLDPPQ